MHWTSKPTFVTQVKLQELARLRQCAADCRVLSQEIRDALDRGAAVEPGSLSAEVVERSQRMFSSKSLEQLFGAAWIEQMRERLPVTATRWVRLLHDDDLASVGSGDTSLRHSTAWEAN